MTGLEDASELASALGIGLLIGSERGWSAREEIEGSRVAGLRTFGLLGLAGGLAAVLAQHGAGPTGIVVSAGAVSAILIGYARDTVHNLNVSATTTIAGVLTIGLGALAAADFPALAAGTAALMVVLLAFRYELHRWIADLSEADIKGIVRFGLIALVALPLLPDRNFGPYAAWNPHAIWLVVVFVTGLSLVGYFAVRRLGATRGTLALAAVGATVSSTAVTVALARQLREPDSPTAVLVAGISIASAVMFVRTLVLTAMLVPFALPTLALVIGPGAIVASGFGLWAAGRSDRMKTPIQSLLSNPFDLRPALAMAAIVVLMSLATRWATLRYGDSGIAVVLAITGAMDVDSAILTMHGLPSETLDTRLAGLILAMPILLNTLVKAGITVTLGGWKCGHRAALPLLASVAAALLALIAAVTGNYA